MTDLIARLRDRVIYDSRHYTPDPLLKEAADRIEALNAEVARLRGKLEKMQRSRDRYREAWEAEKAHGTERVRAALGDEA